MVHSGSGSSSTCVSWWVERDRPPGVPARTLGPCEPCLRACLPALSRPSLKLPSLKTTHLLRALGDTARCGWSLASCAGADAAGEATFGLLCRSGVLRLGRDGWTLASCAGADAAGCWHWQAASSRDRGQSGLAASCRLTRRTTCLPCLAIGGAQPACGESYGPLIRRAGRVGSVLKKPLSSPVPGRRRLRCERWPCLLCRCGGCGGRLRIPTRLRVGREDETSGWVNHPPSAKRRENPTFKERLPQSFRSVGLSAAVLGTRLPADEKQHTCCIPRRSRLARHRWVGDLPCQRGQLPRQPQPLRGSG